MNQRNLQIPLSGGSAPVLMYEPDGVAHGTVLLYHGLGASKEVQIKELEWLAQSGIRALCVDAPHHGERKDGLLDELEVAENPHPRFIEIIRDAALEVPALVDFCLQNFGGKVAIAGISLGGFISFAAVPVEKRLSACVPILGSPDWNHRDGRQPDVHLLELMKQAPIHFPEVFPPCALLIANAAKDILVPPHASRVFADKLAPFYADVPERLHYLEYPESEHMMREQDWVDLWRQIVTWLFRFLK